MQCQISSRMENRQRDTEVIKIRVFRKVSSKLFSFIRGKRQHLWTIEQRRYSRLTFVKNTINNSPKVLRTKFLRNEGFFCFSSIYKFGSFQNPFTAITSLCKLYFRLGKYPHHQKQLQGHTSMHNMALKLSWYFYLLMERPLVRYFQVCSPQYLAAQCNHKTPISVSSR